jgi:hypothetical protein
LPTCFNEERAEVEKSSPCLSISPRVTCDLGLVTGDDIVRAQIGDFPSIKPRFKVADVRLKAKVMTKGIEGVVGLCVA